MDLFQAILLGVIQGLTEFLPVSSSGHLILGQIFLGLQNPQTFILFDLCCHLGTLVAIVAFFYKEIYRTLFVERTRLLQVCAALLPLFPLLLLLKPLKALFDQPKYLSVFFAMTSLLLYLGLRFGREKEEKFIRAHRWRDSLMIGLFQAMAVLPGVSRSGATLSAARLAGWSREEAVTFSFLIAIPTILGASFIEAAQLFSSAEQFSSERISLQVYFAGWAASLVVGYAALGLLKKIVMSNQLMLFVWYCLGLSFFCLLAFNF